ncbi:PLP-dependent cysteine synthase family protein [Pseudonocardia sp. HH130630-07]|uniref:PLP-dependent cysteine synthase family protein n=1 Tax=Pseudonocardia sp. HH130630-07 TaxID=1690815 RepID=UPI0008151C38|nr:pyridoxal-phosphate dependent enzyme [Pseudonocardia sp. HH130630-07]ANY09591.1 cystathionine beta-synthase [Pseudonocardia sp. HH130630-07]
MATQTSGGPVYDSVLDAVGATPLVRLGRIVPDGGAPVWVKTEGTNPGGSVKDRAAVAMVRAAEESGALRHGGTIVEGTSGNTGVGLAMVAAARGYRAVLVVPDRTTPEKIALLRAYGAEVVTTPGLVPKQDPRHVQQLAARIAAETPGGWLADQYGNPANPDVHEHTTGPEIWTQTGGRVTHLVAGAGTGGTVTGAGRYLSARGVQVVAADPWTSRYGGGDGSPYAVEAVGHYLHPLTETDTWPAVYDTAVPNRTERVDDGESLRTLRRLAREEGLLVGGSGGLAVAAALRVSAQAGPDGLVVAVLPDSGRIYLSRYFDDARLRTLGFLDAPQGPLVRDAVGPYEPGLRVAPATATVAEVRAGLGDGPLPDLVPVVQPRTTDATTWAVPDVVGCVRVAELAGLAADDRVGAHAGPPPVTVGHGEGLDEALTRLDADGVGSGDPVLVLVDGRAVTQVHRSDLRR